VGAVGAGAGPSSINPSIDIGARQLALLRATCITVNLASLSWPIRPAVQFLSFADGGQIDARADAVKIAI
jgi:hypothetical protein